MLKELSTPEQNPINLDKTRRLRLAALRKASEQDGILVLDSRESQWASDQARATAATSSHEVPDIAAHRAAETAANNSPEVAAPEVPQHVGQVVVEQMPDRIEPSAH